MVLRPHCILTRHRDLSPNAGLPCMAFAKRPDTVRSVVSTVRGQRSALLGISINVFISIHYKNYPTGTGIALCRARTFLVYNSEIRT
jgi:hypothetical protein